MENLAIGCDVEDTKRFSIDFVKNQLFLDRIFTHQELDYCLSCTDPAPHLTARFCAKESVIKALSSFGIHQVSYKSVEICNGDGGVPYIRFHAESAEHSFSDNYAVSISLSHSATAAMAVALITRLLPRLESQS